MVRPLDQQVVVITGASSGIGKQTARRFAEAGARVVIAARRGELLEELAQELEDEGHTVLPVVTDVTDPAQVQALVETAVERFEWIDTWVNNAGAGVFGRFDQISPEDFAREIDVTLTSKIHAMRAVLPVMRRQGIGTIVNVGSLFGRIPMPLFSPYVTAEFGLAGLTESVRQELKGSGIEVCLVVPAAVDTPFYDHTRGAYGLKPRPTGPIYHPDTVASAILDCARHPRPQVIVGWATRSVDLFSRLFPSLVRRQVARMSTTMLDTASPIPYVDALYEPTREGRDVRGGWGTTHEHMRFILAEHASSIRTLAGILAVGTGLLLTWKLGLFGRPKPQARPQAVPEREDLDRLRGPRLKHLLVALAALAGSRSPLDRAVDAIQGWPRMRS